MSIQDSIQDILTSIDNGRMALPEFQRGYVWNRNQVRGFFESLYRRHPVGGLLVWATKSETAEHRGDNQLAAGMVELLLDGQQRMTTLYGVIRGKPPEFFDGDAKTFTGLHFHMETESFAFYQASKMKGDPLWVDVTRLMKKGLGEFIQGLSSNPDTADSAAKYLDRLNTLRSIIDINLHIDKVMGEDKTVDVVVDIFNRVNSGGTKLSKGDLALANICAKWPDARNLLKDKIAALEKHGYKFTLDWLLRSVTTVLTGEAKFHFLYDRSVDDLQDAFKRSFKHIDACLNMIANKTGLDHDQVLLARLAIPVMVRYLDQRDGSLDHKEQDRLLFWYVQSGMWGRYSGSVETIINADIDALSGDDGGLNRLIKQLRLSRGSLTVETEHFAGYGRGARFYPILYLLTRMGQARDLCSGQELNKGLLGRMSSLEVHHIFPKAKLRGLYSQSEINAVGNFCLLTEQCNKGISDRLPEEYLPEREAKNPGVLASQWIPDDPSLWTVDRYPDFLEARKALLADATNRLLGELLHGDTQWLGTAAPVTEQTKPAAPGGISDGDEEFELDAVNQWMQEHDLPAGELLHEYADPDSGAQLAVFDLAWPHGIQEELSQPVVLLLNEPTEVLAVANKAGYRCFDSVAEFKDYVSREILDESESST